jgi:hypothetical protein
VRPLLTVFLCLLFAAPAGATAVSGTLPGNTTWDAAGSPYVLSGDVTVPAGVTLSIGPGAQVVNHLGRVRVFGRLLAVGTPASPITITTEDGGTGLEANGSAQTRVEQVTFSGTTTNALQTTASTVTIDDSRFAGYSTTGVIADGAGSLAVSDSRFDGAASGGNAYGVQVTGAATPVTIDRSTFVRHYRGLDFQDGGPSLAVRDNIFQANYVGIFLASQQPTPRTYVVDRNAIARNTIGVTTRIWVATGFGARDNSIIDNAQRSWVAVQGTGDGRLYAHGNWWGTTSGATIGNSLYDEPDARVDYNGWLNAAAPATPVPDTTAPDTTITAQPPAQSTSAVATFSFSTSEPSDGAHFECRLDDPTWTPCTSPVSYSALADGTHHFEVHAADGFENIDASPAVWDWTVSTSPPNTTILGGPPALVNTRSASFDLVSSKPGSTFECRLDTAAYAPCTTPVSYSNLVDSTHTFRARATDSEGRVDPTEAVWTWNIDATPPDTTISGGPASLVGVTTASFTLGGTDSGGSYECRLDGAAFAACTSPAAYSGLADGPHVFEARAKDKAGNLDPSPASRSWTVDTVAPDTTIDSGPPSFTFSSPDGGVTFQCALDAASFSACTSPKTYPNLTQGSHSLKVRSIDPAGNIDQSPAQTAWVIDTVAPAVPSITSPVQNASLPFGPVTLSGNAEAASTVTVTEGGVSVGSTAAAGNGAWSLTLSPTSGAHAYRASARDAAGNTSAESVARNITVAAAPNPDPTPTPSPDPTPTPSSDPTPTPSPDPTPTPSPNPTPTPPPDPTPTPSPDPTPTPSPDPTPTPSPDPTPTPSPDPTPTPSPDPTPTPSPDPTPTPSPEPTASPAPTASPTPSDPAPATTTTPDPGPQPDSTAPFDGPTALTPPFTAPMAPPRSLALPAVKGRVAAGRRVTCHPGRWAGEAIIFTYRWKVGGKAVRGATKRILKLSRTAKKRPVACIVTAANAAGKVTASSRTLKAR